MRMFLVSGTSLRNYYLLLEIVVHFDEGQLVFELLNAEKLAFSSNDSENLGKSSLYMQYTIIQITKIRMIHFEITT